MKIILDLQHCQAHGSEPCYACRFASALLRCAKGHDIHLLLSGGSSETVEQLRGRFARFLPPERMHLFEVPCGDAVQEMQIAALLRETVLDVLAPDVVHVIDPFTEQAGLVVTPPLFSNPAVVTSVFLPQLPASFPCCGSPRQLLAAQGIKRAELIVCSSDTAAEAASRQLQVSEDRILVLEELDAADEHALDRAADHLLQAWADRRSPLQPARKCSAVSRRPSMAFLSPLPPAQSGIADYSAELLPELACHYEITLITDQTEITAPWLSSVFPVRSIAWFEQHGDRFDRILYHIGNSHFHSHMFSLLLRHPGTIVLHDSFLADIMEGLGHAAGDPDALLRIAYRDHGYPPLQQAHRQGRDTLPGAYPCSLHIIHRAAGVLVHSRFSRDLLIQRYGATLTPLLQQIPFMRLPLPLPDRISARARLGISPDSFLVCSFGFLGPTKLNHLLLAAWQGSKISRDPRCSLIFVGNNHQGEYGRELQKELQRQTGPGIVDITGFIPPETYRDYLAAADLAVQLRANSRGETSAAVYDCLAAGLPLICNAHGSSAELPEDTVIMLPDQLDEIRLRQALEQVYGDPEESRTRAGRATAWFRQEHHPVRVGEAYCQAIEQVVRTSPRAHERQLLATLPPAETAARRAALAASLSANRPPCGIRQLLVDISAVARHDLKTGIERVVRSIVMELLQEPPAGYRIEPVYYNDQGGYSYARRFTLKALGLDEQLLEDEPVQAGSNDLFLGADLILAAIPQVADCLRLWRMRGVQISFIVYDLLPLQRPDCFPPHIEPAYRTWLEIVGSVADHLVCISKAVADELQEQFRQTPPARCTPLQIGHFHLGADIDASLPTAGLPTDAEQTLQAIASAPAFLMVSTIEPRKGHTQALDAFELLWQQGIEVNLVIVGKPGWMTEQLIDRLDRHPQQGRHLFCLYSVSDEMLALTYKNCTCLLAPSEGEGFGLPLIEGAQHCLPLIVRDIPVFREVAGGHATYFDGRTPEELADAIRRWLQQPEEERISSSGMPWLTWRQSAQQLLEAIAVS